MADSGNLSLNSTVNCPVLDNDPICYQNAPGKLGIQSKKTSICSTHNKENCRECDVAHKTSFMYKSLFESYLNGNFCDAMLRTEDDGCFPVHRIVLCGESEYFRALFTSTINSEPKTDFLIGEISAEYLEACLLFVYTQKICLDNENIIQILQASDYLGLNTLKAICTDYIKNQLDISNCFAVKHLAKSYFCTNLENTTNKFILRNFGQIAEESDELLEQALPDILEVLKSEELNVKSEEVVWSAIVRWISHDAGTRKQYIADLLPTMRTGLLTTSFFMENIKNHPFVAHNEAVRPLVIKTLRFLYDLDVCSKGGSRVFITRTAPLIAKPRLPHEVMFAVGGWSEGAPTDCIEAYDTKADRWRVIPEVDPDGPRAYHGTVALGFEIVILGGFNGQSYFNSTRAFNVLTKKWRNLAPMLVRRCYVSVVLYNRKDIYVFGGFDGLTRLNTCECYDPEINQWSPIPPMVEQRSDASATVLNGKIYVCGGFNGMECLQSVEMFDPSTRQWSKVAHMRFRRSGLSCVSYRGLMYALGGFNGLSRLISGEKYDPKTNTWSGIKDMYLGRSNFGTGIIDDMIFSIGGFDGVSTTRHVECYNTQKDEWYEASDMQVFRSALSCCIVSDIKNIFDYVQEDRENLLEKSQRIVINPLTHSNQIRENEL